MSAGGVGRKGGAAGLGSPREGSGGLRRERGQMARGESPRGGNQVKKGAANREATVSRERGPEDTRDQRHCGDKNGGRGENWGGGGPGTP